jgi:hypothetical protein
VRKQRLNCLRGMIALVFFSTAVTALAQPAGSTARRITRDDVVREKQDFARQPKVALIVGVGNYPDASGLSKLKYASKDAKQVAATLEEHGYLVRTLTDTDAMRGSVRRSITELGKALDPQQGTFLFYFSGHGFAHNGANYLATFGTTAMESDIEREGLPLKEIEQLLKETGAKRQLMFIDACRNEPTIGSKSVPSTSFVADRRQRLSTNVGLRVLYSTRAGDVSYENGELQQGVFTHFLLRALLGEASGYSREDRSRDGVISFSDVRDYVIENMRAYGVKRGQVQVPYEGGESTGDFLVGGKEVPGPKAEAVMAMNTPPPPVQAPQQQTQAPAPVKQPTQTASIPPQGQRQRGIGPGIAEIAGEGDTAKLAALPQVWRNLINNQFYTFRFDAGHLYVAERQGGAVVAELTLKKGKKDKPDYYEGLMLGSPCPGGRGGFEVRSWTPTRIEARIEVPTNPQQPFCGGFGFMRSWVNVSFIPE